MNLSKRACIIIICVGRNALLFTVYDFLILLKNIIFCPEPPLMTMRVNCLLVPISQQYSGKGSLFFSLHNISMTVLNKRSSKSSSRETATPQVTVSVKDLVSEDIS